MENALTKSRRYLSEARVMIVSADAHHVHAHVRGHGRVYTSRGPVTRMLASSFSLYKPFEVDGTTGGEVAPSKVRGHVPREA